MKAFKRLIQAGIVTVIVLGLFLLVTVFMPGKISELVFNPTFIGVLYLLAWVELMFVLDL